MTIRQRIDAALDALLTGLNPFVAQQLELKYRNGWFERAKAAARISSVPVDRQGRGRFDVSALVAIILDQWDPVFSQVLGKREMSLVHEMRAIRNAHMHQEDFDADRGLAALISIESLLNAVSAGEPAEQVRKLKEETGAERFASRSAPAGDAASSPAGATPVAELIPVELEDKTLAPWRSIIVPHEDVANRSFVKAEFAADLYQVAFGSGSAEYADPVEFFDRTYLTTGLKALLDSAIRRFTDRGGEPIVELQTSFGGGKTHALLALFHLAAAAAPKELPGVAALMADAGVDALPRIRRAVVVGTKLQAGQPLRKPDGTEVRTLWGEIAYQLGGRESYELVAGADRTATSPGAAFDEVLRRAAPCLILVDEWVAYARQLGEDTVLCGGTFETQFTFAQTLTEAAAATPGAMVVVSLPVTEDRRDGSEIEVGGARGRAALERLRNVLARQQANWQPAEAEESYAIVRRRLFQSLDAEAERRRDAVCKRIHKYYREKRDFFPPHAAEPSYLERLLACYPIHPELFERMYNEWGAIEEFQRTRGVLRLMAAVIHTLWSSGDNQPLILPGLLPLGEPAIAGDLVRYLGEPWRSVLNRDVVGPEAVAARIDGKVATLGRLQATARTARSLFFATAPQSPETSTASRVHGIDARTVRLGGAFPGDQLGAFDEALRRLRTESGHVNTDDTRYWFSLTPNLNRRADEMAAQYDVHEVHDEILRRLVPWQRERARFARVHVVSDSTAALPDEPQTRLAILGPKYLHAPRRESTEARRFASAATVTCGDSERIYRNCVVFLAPDERAYEDVDRAVRRSMAWRRIVEDKDREEFVLTNVQARLAERTARQAADAADREMRACWRHVLIPTQQASVGAPIVLSETRVTAGDRPVETVAAQLERDGLMAVTLGGVNLRHEIDDKRLWSDDATIELSRLVEYFARYPYMRRLAGKETLRGAVISGVANLAYEAETFGYAEGLHDGEPQGLMVDRQLLPDQVDLQHGALVRGEEAAAIARRLLRPGDVTDPPADALPVASDDSSPPGAETPAPSGNRRSFFIRVPLEDPTKLPRVASQLVNDIIALVIAASPSSVEASVEFSAQFSAPLPRETVERTTLNAAELGFPSPEFGD